MQDSDPYNIENLLGNATPAGATPAPPGWKGIGNYLFIEHEDGTFAVYFHLDVNSVIPKVGDHIQRGEQLATVGMTGSATGPHVHFGVATNETHNQAAYVHRVRYEASLSSGQGSTVNSCYIPRSTDTFSSTNNAPVPD